MRTLPSFLTLTAVAAVVLTGCSATPDDAESTSAATSAPISCTDSGSVSDSVVVEGAADVEPTVTFPSPLTVDATERTVVSAGDGAEIETGDSTWISYAAYNATTGAKLSAGGYGDAAGLLVNVTESTGIIPGILKGVACSSVGDRVAVVMPPADGFGEGGNAQLGVAPTDQILFVIDIAEQVPTRADGEAQEPVDGLPTVTLADDGAPTVKVPDTEAPTDLGIEVLQKGDGATVADGDTVAVQYTGVIWGTGEVFDQSWGGGGPAAFATTDVVPGFGQGLVGQTVGSQVLIVIPPELGYGAEGNSTAGISGTDTLVFAVDILSIG